MEFDLKSWLIKIKIKGYWLYSSLYVLLANTLGYLIAKKALEDRLNEIVLASVDSFQKMFCDDLVMQASAKGYLQVSMILINLTLLQFLL